MNTAAIPVPKLESDIYDWFGRHDRILKFKSTSNPEIVLIGDSITHFWGGCPDVPQNGTRAWNATFAGRRVLNLGFGWDRTQNVLWRLIHGEIDGLAPRWIVLNIGSNNLIETVNARENTSDEIIAGIHEICRLINLQSPRSNIVHMAIFPRGARAENHLRSKITSVNRLLSAYAASQNREFIDLTEKLTDRDGCIPVDIMPDACHPSEKGYAIWGAELLRLIQ